jgi:hypothetical protein
MPPLPGDGLSEQFMLNVVQALGTMQQQFLRQVQDSLRETLAQFSSAYEQRLDALERSHAALCDELVHSHAPTPVTPTADQRAGFETPREDGPPAFPVNGSRTARVHPIPAGPSKAPPAAQTASRTEAAKPARYGAAASGQHPPEPRDRSGPPAAAPPGAPLSEQSALSPDDGTVPTDADDRARWMREQIRSIELDLETTGRGWEKKLVELLGQ